MLQFVFTNLLMISLGAVLYLGARTLPRLEAEEATEKSYSWIEKFVMSEMPHKIDAAVNYYAGKTFRKTKVLILRLDNYLTMKLKKLNNEGMGITGAVKPKIDLGSVEGIQTDTYTGPDRRRSGLMNEKVVD